MKPRSAKNKGKRLQNDIRDLILKLYEDVLQADDVRSTTMGDGGEDVQLSPAARKYIPFQIECKNRGRMSVFKDYAQAQEHGPHNPLLIIKQDGSKPLAVLDAELFFTNYVRK